ncbi:hypothetical protein J6590_102575, partial [Homalodisca vitripennis]
TSQYVKGSAGGTVYLKGFAALKSIQPVCAKGKGMWTFSLTENFSEIFSPLVYTTGNNFCPKKFYETSSFRIL